MSELTETCNVFYTWGYNNIKSSYDLIQYKDENDGIGWGKWMVNIFSPNKSKTQQPKNQYAKSWGKAFMARIWFITSLAISSVKVFLYFLSSTIYLGHFIVYWGKRKKNFYSHAEGLINSLDEMLKALIGAACPSIIYSVSNTNILKKIKHIIYGIRIALEIFGALRVMQIASRFFPNMLGLPRILF